MREKLGLLGCLAALGVLLLCSADTARAVREGLALCAGSVIPALFPFLAVSGLLTALDAGAAPGRGRMLLARVLGCGPAGAGAFLLGLVGSYPVGARTVAQLYREKRISRPEACRLLLFCNNCGPAFALGVAGAGCFGSLRAGVWLWLIHVSAAVLTALLTRSTSSPEGQTSPSAPQALSSAFPGAVRGAGEGMLHVCGFVVFFLVLTRLLTALTGLEHPLPLGLLELTGGILRLSGTRGDFVLAAALMGWGGVCVHCQTAAVLEGSGLHMRGYLSAKAAQAVLSAALAVPISRWVR